MDARRDGDGRGGARDRLPARPRRVGRRTGSRRYREKQAAADVHERCRRPSTERAASRRVRLVASSSRRRRDVKEARVPAGTTIFDCASWNGVAIDSTCGGHGTCKKCKVRVVVRRAGRVAASTRARSRPTSCAPAGGSPAARRREEDLVVEVPPLQTRPKAALVGVGRHVILRPAVQKRYLELDRADARGSASRTSSACSRRWTTSSSRVPLDARARARRDAARRELEGDRGASSTTC